MKRKCEIYTMEDAIEVDKNNGTHVLYYLFDEYEIHLNTIAPYSKQEWHYHSQIEEIILIQTGVLTCYEKYNDKILRKDIYENELICVNQSIHTFANETNQEVKMIVFRLVLDGYSKREIFKNDKKIVEEKI